MEKMKEKQIKKRKYSRPTTAKKYEKIAKNFAENGGKMSEAIRDAGLSESMARNPQKITDSKTWNEVVEEFLPDSELTEKHKELLNSTRIDHMVFPLGPKKNSEKEEWLKASGNKEVKDVLSDEEITEMLAEVNCKVRRIVHGEQARHVYFWSSDNRAKKDALDMAYKLKGRFSDDPGVRPPHGNIYNIFLNGPQAEKIKVLEGEIKNALIQQPKKNDQEN